MKHGFCCSVAPLALILAGGLGVLSYCHHGCGNHGWFCHANPSCSSCHDTPSSCHGNSCAHHSICKKCGGSYSLGDSHRNERLCPECFRLLREDLASRNNPASKKAVCEECGTSYVTTKSDDCGLCQECLANWCSHNN